MKRFISFVLCLVLMLSCMNGLFSVQAVDGTAAIYNGFNTADDVSRSGILSLCGSGTKTLDTNDKAEGAGSVLIDMPATLDSMVANFAFYTDLESASYYTLADYDYLEILYKSDVTLIGDYKMQVRLVDKAVSVAGGGYEYEVAADLTADQWNKAVFDLSNPYYTLAGMQGKFDRIRLVMINNSGSYKEIDIRFDGVLLYNEEYKIARDAALKTAEDKIAALPQVTESNLTEVKAGLDEIAPLLNSEYQNFIPANYSEYLTKKTLYEQYASGLDPTKAETLLFNGFNTNTDLNKTGALSLAGDSTKGIDPTVKYMGDGSLRIDMATQNGSFLSPYGYYFDIDRDCIDYTKYDYVEVMYKSDKVCAGEYHLQMHLIDTAVSTEGSGYDYDSGITLDGTWHRLSQSLSAPYYTLSGIGNNINRIRFILLNYTGAYQETDMNVDSIFFCNKAYADARTNAEQAVALLIDALPDVTEANYKQLAGHINGIEAALAEGKENYVNFIPANFSAYSAKKAKYDAYVSRTGAVNDFAMPNFFADNMMFQQNKPMNLFGLSTAGKTISGELYLGDSLQPIETKRVEVPFSGNWTLSFDARKGCYDVYRIVVYEDGKPLKTITNVLVGEVWIAAGQSNMEYRLDWEINGAEEIANANDRYMRILHMTGNPVGTAGVARATPAFDIAGAYWVDGSAATSIATMSANGYYAAKQMRQALDVPVAIINAALGSTNIQTWLSRESIEDNGTVKSLLQKNNLYKTETESATTPADYRHMTALYNTKIGPMAGMNLGGVLWCQGESNCDGKPNETGYYSQAIQALASGYSKAFGFEKGDMPVIVINIANHVYLGDPQIIPKWIEEIADAQAANPNIVNIPIYDVPLTYVNPPAPNVAYAIHPNTKYIGGGRAGLASAHNFCGYGNADYYAPTVKSFEIKNGAIYVTFDHVAEGLTTLNNSIGVHGFTIASKSGLFLPAKAKIEGKNVVKVWNDSITDPVNFTYAFNSHAQSANLCNSYQLPAVPYRSNRKMTQYFCSNDWLYCDTTSVFVDSGATGKYVPTWQGTGLGDVYAIVSVDNAIRQEGTGSIKIAYDTTSKATAGASVYYGQYLMPFSLHRYKTISIMVRNDDTRNKTLRFLVGKQDGEEMWMLPTADGAYEVTLPGGSDFTCYTFAIKNAKGYNTEVSAPMTQINRIDVLVEDTASGSIHIDNVMVGLSLEQLENNQTAAKAVEDLIAALPEADVITLDHEEAVNTADQAYENLTVAQRELVTNQTKLLRAKAKIAQLKGETTYLYGDVDGNGKVEATDALEVLKSVVGKVDLTGEQLIVADTDGNGKADATDALNILKKVVGKIDKFPVEE